MAQWRGHHLAENGAAAERQPNGEACFRRAADRSSGLLAGALGAPAGKPMRNGSPITRTREACPGNAANDAAQTGATRLFVLASICLVGHLLPSVASRVVEMLAHVAEIGGP